jgi:hypothetical protein
MYIARGAGEGKGPNGHSSDRNGKEMGNSELKSMETMRT